MLFTKFDSSSVFAKILDDKRGRILDGNKTKISYFTNLSKNTCILRTVFRNENHEFEVIDFMPRFIKNKGKFYAPPEIIRIVRPIKGSAEIKFKYDPRLEYAQGETKHVVKKNMIRNNVDSPKHDSLFLYTNIENVKITQSNSHKLEETIF